MNFVYEIHVDPVTNSVYMATMSGLAKFILPPTTK